MATLPAKFDITRPEIERVVVAFYAQIREHDVLGPVFAKHITDWVPHEAKIARFWASAILHERSYDGNPMAAHIKAGNVRPGMFSVWLGLFDTVLKAELQPDQARMWSTLAHRIGRSLRAGVVDRNISSGGVPNLR